jgi:hypothetical protein
MRKLQLHNTAAVTMYAITNGLAANDAPDIQARDAVTDLRKRATPSQLLNAPATACIS